MLKTVITDLRSKIRLWLPAIVALVVGAACAGGVVTAISTGLQTAGTASELDAVEGVRVLGGTIGMLTMLTAAGIIGSTAGFVIASQSQEYALWLICGFTPVQLRRILRMKIFVLSLIAGVIAVPLTYIAATMILWQWSTIGIVTEGQRPVFEYWQPIVVLLLNITAAAWGTWGLTKRASQVSEMEALREARMSKTHIGWTKAITGFLFLVFGCAILFAVIVFPLNGPDDRAAGALSALLILILATLLVPSWTIRPLLLGWTALVPLRSISWYLARESCRFESIRSLATIVPFAIASSLLAVLHGGGAVSGGDTTLAEVGVLVGPALLVSWVGGICVIALIGRSRSRDHALLYAAGSPSNMTLRITCLEGLIYAATALLYGTIFLVASVVLLCAVADIMPVSAISSLPWSIFAGLAALTLATSIIAVVLSAPIREPRLRA